MKAIILPLSTILDNQQQRTEAAFIKLGVGRLALWWHSLPFGFLDKWRGPSIPSLITDYKLGNLSTREFMDSMRAKFSNNISDAQFKAAWNEMQQLTPHTISILNQAKALYKDNVTVYVLAGTNPLHIEDIQQKIGGSLPGIPYLSYEQKALGIKLISNLCANFVKPFPNQRTKSDIVLIYTKPKPLAGRDYFNPLALWSYFMATDYVAKLESAARQQAFTLLEYSPTQDQDKIFDKLPEDEQDELEINASLKSAERELESNYTVEEPEIDNQPSPRFSPSFNKQRYVSCESDDSLEEGEIKSFDEEFDTLLGDNPKCK